MGGCMQEGGCMHCESLKERLQRAVALGTYGEG